MTGMLIAFLLGTLCGLLVAQFITLYAKFRRDGTL